ncbi:LPS export ABC transporter periplasmic protein LptC [Marinilabiliaceae bacterium N1Y90]|nr:LPS export ABC transporter periplasmic protein LptC [Marinilabiliaceae bacterium N1Y90]
MFSASSFLLLAVYVFISSCTSNKPEEIEAIGDREELPALVYKDLESVITDSGRVKYRLLTPDMLRYAKKEAPYMDFPNGLNVIMYLPDGTVEAQIKCSKALYLEKEQLWELNNDVEAVNQKDEVLNTEQLFWDVKEGKIYSEKFVKMTKATEIITGTGFDSDESMKNWEVRDVSGIIALEE